MNEKLNIFQSKYYNLFSDYGINGIHDILQGIGYDINNLGLQKGKNETLNVIG